MNMFICAEFKSRTISFHPDDPLWSTGQDTCLTNGKAVVQTRCSVNAFELKDLNVIRNPLLVAKAVDRQPAMSRSEMRCKD